MASGVDQASLAALARTAEAVQPVVLAREQVLPVLPAFDALLPEAGLRRGTLTQVRGPGATSIALALLAGATAAGSWMAVIGVRGLGLGAAGELGVALERVLLVDVPSASQWITAVAAALDGVDTLLVEPPPHLREADARRLQSRVRDRGAALVVLGRVSPFPADLSLTGSAPEWVGMGEGWGHLRARSVAVEATGRRRASRARTGRLWLPGLDGQVAFEPHTGEVVPFRPSRGPSVRSVS